MLLLLRSDVDDPYFIYLLYLLWHVRPDVINLLYEIVVMVHVVKNHVVAGCHQS